ncbi:MAG TPA: HD domain-containing phosphohydrolase, partial [Ktedonobacteraceae bacterium]|nr:HD domain-containing phosphohydrolase [Ktedonobacteraceae bacterium]
YLAVGAEILSPLPALRPIAELVSACCERVDGSGYPARLKGDEIPLGARIIAVADAYETALAARTTRRGRGSTAAALKEIVRYSGSHFDAHVVCVLPQVLKMSPQLTHIGAA